MTASPLDRDTIAAVSTAQGRGGIAVVKISGPDSLSILRSVFSSRTEPARFPRRMIHGFVRDADGTTIDEALAVYMPGPRSYTGEDVAEIHVHGGYSAASESLSVVLLSGARPAEPGEFTKRAFLNGRIDLVQAEAVMEIVSAESREHLRRAESLLDGGFSRTIRHLLNHITQALARIELSIDFPDQDIEQSDHAEITARIKSASDMIDTLIDSHCTAEKIRHGITIAITGMVNAGKSSLFNALLGRRRAIIHDRPGTTRDWISERIELDGIPVNLVDTAGLRETDDDIERAGIAETERIIRDAEIIVYVLSPGEEPETASISPSSVSIIITGKADLFPVGMRDTRYLAVSTFTGEGLHHLRAILSETCRNMISSSNDGTTVLVERHIRHLANARTHITASLAALESWSEEIAALELHAAEYDISSILGSHTDGAVLDEIFRSFCIGK